MNKKSEYSSPTNFIRQIIDKDLSQGKYNIVHTRFPPEPNGPLHIGHAKAICLNFGIAQDYQGQCNLRLDDTNPTQENQEYVESIKYDVQWMGYQWNGEVRFASNYFEQLYNFAIELIEQHLAYVDELTTETIREYRGTLTIPGKNSPYRNRSVKENLRLFKKMRAGDFSEGAACLRAKIDMASSYMVMRDPILYRIKYVAHHQTGKKWCIYPMYDFTHCISDAMEGITHSLCTLEFQDNRRLYDWILDHLTISTHPRQYEFSRLNLEYAVMSKRKLNMLLLKEIVKEWDDPRMLTIAGLRRRGYTASAIREFCRRIGVTKQKSMVEMSVLEACIRKELNEKSPRAMAVLNPLRVVLENLPPSYTEILRMRNHPTNNLGTRLVPFSREIYIERDDFCEVINNPQYKRLVLGRKVRLRNAYVIKAERVLKDKNNNIICLYCSCDHEKTFFQDNKPATLGIIHWVSVKHALPAQFRIYDYLFNISNPDDARDDNFLAHINPHSFRRCQGFVEPSVVKNTNANTHYQFERIGYFCVDSNDSSATNLVFNLTVELRDQGKKYH
ncbi:MAG: glutamine--tRNA ligase/YqeY domain fusion protein [Candidatus Dasytiphilus stammeri]